MPNNLFISISETPKISCPAEERKGVWKQLKQSVGSFVHSGARNEIGKKLEYVFTEKFHGKYC